MCVFSVEESPPTKKKLEEGNKEKERDEEKEEEKSGDPVAGRMYITSQAVGKNPINLDY